MILIFVQVYLLPWKFLSVLCMWIYGLIGPISYIYQLWGID